MYYHHYIVAVRDLPTHHLKYCDESRFQSRSLFISFLFIELTVYRVRVAARCWFIRERPGGACCGRCARWRILHTYPGIPFVSLLFTAVRRLVTSFALAGDADRQLTPVLHFQFAIGYEYRNRFYSICDRTS